MTFCGGLEANFGEFLDKPCDAVTPKVKPKISGFKWTLPETNRQEKSREPSGFAAFCTSLELLGRKLGAQERTRTSTPLQALGPEPSASTNSATWAKKARILTI
jgi:hypothetical protein